MDLMSCTLQEPVPDDAQYIIDSMAEDDELDQGTYVAISLFVPRDALTDLLQPLYGDRNAFALPMTDYRDRRRYVPALLDLVTHSMTPLPVEVRAAVAGASVNWLARFHGRMVDWLSGWAFEDAIIGGCLENFRKGRNRRMDRHGRPYRRTTRALRTFDYINRYVRRSDDLPLFRRQADYILDVVERAGGVNAAFTDLGKHFDRVRDERRKAQIREWAESQLSKAEQTDRVKVRIRRAKRRQYRAIVKRAVRIGGSVLPATDLSAFVRGERVRLPGQTMDLVVRAASSVVRAGHGALDVAVAAPGGGPELATLCTYYPDTPAMDQLVALSLAMRAGEEEDVLKVANIVEVHPAGETHPLISTRKALDHGLDAGPPASVNLVAEEDCLAVPRAMRYAPKFDTLRETYMQETQSIWLDRVQVHTCGRRTKAMRRYMAEIELSA